MRVQADACAKAILFGEHFVVWGGTALAVPLRSVRLRVSLEVEPAGRNRLVMPDSADEKMRKAVRRGIRELGGRRAQRVKVEIAGDFPHGAGLGSSAAFSVAFCRAWMAAEATSPSSPLGKLGALPPKGGDETGDQSSTSAPRAWDDDLVAQAALEMERVFHERPSGIDSTTIAFETPCYVKTGSHFVVETARSQEGPRAGFIDVPHGAVLVLADTGERRESRSVIRQIAKFARAPKGDTVLARFTGVAEAIALQAANALRKGDFEYVGLMLNENHYLLNAIGVSTQKTEDLRNAALKAGALGAKLTGAGMGGFVLALAAPSKARRLRKALLDAGAAGVIVERT